jgi:hypothetical protein
MRPESLYLERQNTQTAAIAVQQKLHLGERTPNAMVVRDLGPAFLACPHQRHRGRLPTPVCPRLCATSPCRSPLTGTAVVWRPPQPAASPPPPPVPPPLQSFQCDEKGDQEEHGWRPQADAAREMLRRIAQRRTAGRAGDAELVEHARTFITALHPWSSRVRRHRIMLLASLDSYTTVKYERSLDSNNDVAPTTVFSSSQLWLSVRLLALRAMQRAEAAARAEEDEELAKLGCRASFSESFLRDKRRNLLQAICANKAHRNDPERLLARSGPRGVAGSHQLGEFTASGGAYH